MSRADLQRAIDSEIAVGLEELATCGDEVRLSCYASPIGFRYSLVLYSHDRKRKIGITRMVLKDEIMSANGISISGLLLTQVIAAMRAAYRNGQLDSAEARK